MNRIDKFVPRVTVCHHEALPSDTRQCLYGQICISFPQTRIVFLAYFWVLVLEKDQSYF